MRAWKITNKWYGERSLYIKLKKEKSKLTERGPSIAALTALVNLNRHKNDNNYYI